MLRKALASSFYYKACCFVFYFVVAAASFNGYYHKWHFAELDAPGDDLRYHFEMMMDGTAYRPYVQRQLLPAAANWIDSAVPRSFETWLYSGRMVLTRIWTSFSIPKRPRTPTTFSDI